MRSLGQELLPEELLDLPQVRCLPAEEGGAMHAHLRFGKKWV